MIHECKVHCHNLDLELSDTLGIEDKGKWLPFCFHMDMIMAVKMATDDEDELPFNCTTLFTTDGETFIINTPYSEFIRLFKAYHKVLTPTNQSNQTIL